MVCDVDHKPLFFLTQELRLCFAWLRIPTMNAQNTVRGVSDTARWVAYFRALETQRPDALFRDPYA